MYLLRRLYLLLFFFFLNDTATTEIYTLSLHDALPIFQAILGTAAQHGVEMAVDEINSGGGIGGKKLEIDLADSGRSEEHTSELQSHVNLVCRLLLEKKKSTNTLYSYT